VDISNIPPDRVKVYIMSPIHSAIETKLPETKSTTEIAKFTIDFRKYTKLEITLKDGRVFDPYDSDTSSVDPQNVYKENIFNRFRNEIGNFVMTNSETRRIYQGKLGERSGIFLCIRKERGLIQLKRPQI